MNLFNRLNLDIGYVVIGMAIVMFIMLIMLIALIIKNNNLNKRYRRFMAGSGGRSLEKEIANKFKKINNLSNQVKDMNVKVDEISEKLSMSYQKFGIVKYDAFNEMGGKLSFAICLLNAENNGFILNAMHNREGCYTYVKEIIKGESFVLLAEEERKALNEAVGSDDLLI